MARWKLFGRSKAKDEEPECEEFTQVEPETEEKPEKPTLAEHNETLYTEESTSKEGKTYHKKDIESGDQRIWRDLKSIEKNVDNISKGKAKKPEAGLDETVDKILSKKKTK